MRFQRLAIAAMLAFTSISSAVCQHSVARKWNDVLLEAIRNDFARPTVHARNLFHTSAAMYDAWSVFNGNHQKFLLGGTKGGFTSSFTGYPLSNQVESAESLRQKAISYAAYRLIMHRFKNSPGFVDTKRIADSLMIHLGYDPDFVSIEDYKKGSAAALGNLIASEYITFGRSDGSNELNDYSNIYYQPINDFLDPTLPGNVPLSDPNRWQPLAFEVFIDQSGNVIDGSIPEFLGAEWGNVFPFSLADNVLTTYTRNGDRYNVYHDPGPPPYLSEEPDGFYKNGFSMVSLWSSHLDHEKTDYLDISPNSIGGYPLTSFPKSFENYFNFYDFLSGGDPSAGYTMNPYTNQPYQPQLVKLGDYTRVLAEFWADGPDSETPPGHWFSILNYINDDSRLVKKFNGSGETLGALEWDVKAYFILGGAMHDAAIATWSVKGYYDYIRPISAIRYMAEMGQSSDAAQPNYHPHGLPLIDNLIELVSADDMLVGDNQEHLNKIKLKAWRGHDYIESETDIAGVDWILAENWWPYQRQTFVTPNFAGYVSGHSTFSRTAAEVLTLITGDAFFPGGMGEFSALQNEFLVFEEGPSEDVILQWATYRDAADQCSLSRIWGGIHPPADDLPGRIMGEQIGIDAFYYGASYFERQPLSTGPQTAGNVVVYPNPVKDVIHINFDKIYHPSTSLTFFNLNGEVIKQYNIASDHAITLSLPEWREKAVFLNIRSGALNSYRKLFFE